MGAYYAAVCAHASVCSVCLLHVCAHVDTTLLHNWTNTFSHHYNTCQMHHFCESIRKVRNFTCTRICCSTYTQKSFIHAHIRRLNAHCTAHEETEGALHLPFIRYPFRLTQCTHKKASICSSRFACTILHPNMLDCKYVSTNVDCIIVTRKQCMRHDWADEANP